MSRRKFIQDMDAITSSDLATDDVFIVEDISADETKKITKSEMAIAFAGGGGSDADAIHDNVDGEINAITAKGSLVDADEFIIEDSAASYAKKKTLWSTIKSAIKTYYDSVTATLTNKTIDADSNTISNIGDEELKTGIDAAKIADGSVSNTEFQYVNGVTSAIQTQIDGKADSSHTHTLTDITDSGALAALDTVGTAEIDNDAVTFDKIANIATNRVLARSSAGSGSVEALTLPNFRTLINVEDGATADQTGAEIKALYEAETNTNAFTDAEQSKLSGIESGADVTDETNVVSALSGATLSDAGTPQATDKVLVQDSSDLDNLKYVDFSDFSSGTTVDVVSNVAADRILGRITAGSGDSEELTATQVRTLINVEDGATADQTAAEIKTAYESNADTNAFTDAEQTKLSGIETGATADQTDLEIKIAYENNLNTNAFTNAEQTKLAGIETGADVTDEENVTDALDGATLTAATVATGDKVLIQDADDSDILKTATAQSIADLYNTSATKTSEGIVELATTAEIDTGTDTTRAMPIDQFVASKRNIEWIVFDCVAPDTDCAVDTNLVGDFVSPIAGTILQSDSSPFYLYATNSTAGAPTGTMVVDVNINGTSIMTTNKLDFDATEKRTTTAATPPDLTTTSLAVGDIITIDIDSVHLTPAKGLKVYMAVRQ